MKDILLNQKLPLLGNQELVGPAFLSLGPRTVLFDKHERKEENQQSLTTDMCDGGRLVHCGQWFSKCGLWTTAAASPGNLLEMQILGPQPRLTESETLRVGPSNLYFYKLWEPLV